MAYDYDPNFDPSTLASDPAYAVDPNSYNAMTSEPENQTSDSETSSKVYCVCREPEGERLMVYCDSCGEWFHAECIKMDENTAKRLPTFTCHNCNGGTWPRKAQIKAVMGITLNAPPSSPFPALHDPSFDPSDLLTLLLTPWSNFLLLICLLGNVIEQPQLRRTWS